MSRNVLVDACRDHARSRGAEGTRALYLAHLDRWLAWCDRNEVNPCHPRQRDTTAFRDELLSSLASNTVRGILTALSAMYAAAVNRPKPPVEWNPWTENSLPRPKQDRHGKTEAVKAEVAQAMLAAAAADETPRGRRDRALLQILRHTSLRRQSIATLEWENFIRRDEGAIFRVRLKGGFWGEVELVDEIVQALDAHKVSHPTSRFVFPAARSRSGEEQPVAVSTVNAIIKARATEVGHPGAHPHQFRAAFITSALDAGVALVDVQRAAHHADPATTLRYDRGKRGAGVAARVAEHRKTLGQDGK